jgi:putative addiction module antidote
MLKTPVRRIGNSLGIILPKAIVERFQLKEGDEMNLVETEDGVMLSPFNGEFARWAKAYERTNKKHKNLLRALSK